MMNSPVKDDSIRPEQNYSGQQASLSIEKSFLSLFGFVFAIYIVNS